MLILKIGKSWVIICRSIVIYSNEKNDMFISKTETFSEYYVIFADVNKIDLPLWKTKTALFSTKNDLKVCQVSLPFPV